MKTKATTPRSEHVRGGLPVIEQVSLPFVEVQGAAHTITYVNPAFCRLVGRPLLELVGRRFAEIVPGGEACVAVLDRVFAAGEPTRNEEAADTERSTEWLYALWPAVDQAERRVGVIIQVTWADDFYRNAASINEALLISGLHQHELTATAETLNARLTEEIAERNLAQTALHEANRRLAEQAGELERLVAVRTSKLRETVGDLEMFSYSVAHDLRGPLRSMEGLARIVLTEHASGLDAAGGVLLKRIALSAARMNGLIQDVLDYSTVMRTPVVLTAVDLEELIGEIVAGYPHWQPPQVEIVVAGPMPRVLGHDGFLTQCISNLLSNAVKFVAPGVMPRVRIRAERAGTGVVRLSFEDNGIGIAAKDRGRVFRMFDRLNPAEQFEGSGIGLMIARKAVERLGGSVDFESAPSGGSRFWLDLQAAPEAVSTAAVPGPEERSGPL